MQLKIYQRINQLILALIASIILFGAIIIVNVNRFDAYRNLFIAFMVLYPTFCLFLIFFIDKNWDKHLIQKMSLNGQIALANIHNAQPLMPIKDASGKRYMLYQLDCTVYTQDHKTLSLSFSEKMNAEIEHIPSGSVFITYDENKKGVYFVIPNMLISHIPTLEPIVKAYEKNKAIPLKYLNVYNKTGLIIEEYRESLKKNKSGAQ